MAKEKITDEELITRIRGEITSSLGYMGDTISQQRETAMQYYYALPFGNEVEGRSQYVDSTVQDTIEWIKPSLMRVFGSGDEMVKFTPHGPEDVAAAAQATDYVNHVFTKDNPGWEILYSWFTDALLSKNGIVKVWWDEYSEEKREEYSNLSDIEFQYIIADEDVEVIEHSEIIEEQTQEVYHDLVIKRSSYDGRVKVENIPPSEFLIARESKDIQDSRFVCHRVLKTLSELREMYPDQDLDVSELGGGDDDLMAFSGERLERFAYDQSSKYWEGWGDEGMPDEEGLRTYWLHESYLKTDWDGDGITELRKVCTVGNTILANDAIDSVPFVSITPIKIPHKFFGLSIADLTRSSTLAATAILRGFVENTYLTNYSPKLADPNVVDFSALQNMKPKQIIPTNGSPQGAVAALPPETISTGTVPLLQHLQIIKEQATGMSKAAQGLNDTLYVSGNSEGKMAAVQSASQKRIQHIARRFAETGLKRLCEGVYSTIRKQINQMNVCVGGMTEVVDCGNLPDRMECDVILDIGENSNANLINKLTTVGQQVLPALNAAGAGSIIKPESPAVLATKLLEAMGLSSNDFLEDYTTDEFKENAAKAVQSQTENAQKTQELQNRKASADVDLSEANVRYTDAQSANTVQDNSKQMAVAIDKHFQEWADLTIKAQKEGAVIPEHPTYDQILGMVAEVMGQGQEQPTEQPIAPEQARQGTQDQMSEQDMMAMMQQQLPI